MNARASRWDLEDQTAAHNRAARDEARSAARADRRELVRLTGLRYDADRVPSPRDVEWEEER